MVKISVVIPTLNEENYIGNLLEQLSACENIYEIIVVDGQSTDRTRDIVTSYHGIRLIKTSPGVGKQRNLGARHATGDAILFFDADVSATNDFIQTFLQEVGERRLDVSCPRFHSSEKRILGRILMFITSGFFYIFQRLQANGAGPCIYVTKDIFEQVNGFSEHLQFEDSIFIRQAATKGSYGVTRSSLAVSDRRFYSEGTRMIWKYLLLGWYVARGDWSSAQQIEYKFNNYNR